MEISKPVAGLGKRKAKLDPTTYLFSLVAAAYRQDELMQQFRRARDAKHQPS